MKNTMKNNNILGALTAVLFVTVLSFGAFGIAPSFAHAQEDDGGDYSGGCCDTIAPTSISYPSDYTGSTIAPSSITYPSDYVDGSIAPSSITYPSDYVDSSTSYPSDYATGGYVGSGYLSGGYMSSGYLSNGYMGGTSYLSGNSYPVSTAPSNTSIYAPTNTSICSNGNNQCNTNITNPAPVINNNNVIVPSAPVYQQQQYCASGYSGTYPNCYLPQPVYSQPVVYQPQPIAYNPTPYVSLSQVPYTGLDLGFWGSIAYWGAFVLFALFAAYLIAIKRVQNTIANSMKAFLFGSEITADEEVAAPAAEVQVEAAPVAVQVAEVQTNGDMIDSFIMSQVNRARTA
jgi:hypothetical protein